MSAQVKGPASGMKIRSVRTAVRIEVMVFSPVSHDCVVGTTCPLFRVTVERDPWKNPWPIAEVSDLF